MYIQSNASRAQVRGLVPRATHHGSRLPLGLAWGYMRAVIRREIAYRATLRRYDHLATLSERLLLDIGVTPETVRRARHNLARGRLRDHLI
ncbi:MAG: hypothetical protein AAGA28_13745 [Pseudomonadota bacterium]